MTEEDKRCEAFFKKETVKDGVQCESVVIQGIGMTPDDAMRLFRDVKKEMNQ